MTPFAYHYSKLRIKLSQFKGSKECTTEQQMITLYSQVPPTTTFPKNTFGTGHDKPIG